MTTADEDLDIQVTEDDYDEYQSSVGFYIKKVWISVQVLIMTQFMIRGMIYYCKALPYYFDKTRLLLIF